VKPAGEREEANDNQGIRYLLPSLFARDGAWERAAELLDRVGADGTNLYTRCLAALAAGRRREALRWLCAAVSYNPYMPDVLLGEKPTDPDDPGPRYVTVGGLSEALDYARNDGAQGEGPRVLAPPSLTPTTSSRRAASLCWRRLASSSSSIRGTGESGFSGSSGRSGCRCRGRGPWPLLGVGRRCRDRGGL